MFTNLVATNIDILETLEYLRAEVKALAEQEAEQMREEIPTQEDKQIKQGSYLENEVKKWNIKDIGKLGDLWEGREETYEEHEKNNYRSEWHRC